MEEVEHQDLDKPINGVLRNLNNTQPRQESMHQTRDLSFNYSLRENPKKKTHKSFGLVESPESIKKVMFRCGECGKGFRYEKCLSNHQAGMHSSTTKQRVYEEEGEEEPMKSLCSSFSLVRKKKRSSRVMRYKKTPLSCSFTTFLESRSVFAANDEELEVAECLILLSKSSPKFVVDGLKLVAEAMDADPETPKGSYDSVCLRNKKPRKGGEFESRFFSNERKVMEERVGSFETSKEPAIVLGLKCQLDQQKLRKGGVFGTRFSSNELNQQKLRKGGDFGYNFERNELGVRAMECSDSDKENIEHQCKLCNKIFSCYQALGGHQTFHRNRMSKSKNKKNCRYESVEEPEGDESVAVTVKQEKKKRHKCNICSRLFRSVHALGGHKKCHGKWQHSKTEDDHQDLGFLSVGIKFY